MSIADADLSNPAGLYSLFARVRKVSEQIAEPLEPEDQVVQSMPDVSPTKWHLAHTTWFFETFLLVPHLPGYVSHHPEFQYLFNSYYNAVGQRLPRPSRGLLSRPTVRQVLDYRVLVDDAMSRLLADPSPRVAPVAEIGIHHEQQHQELMLMDIKHVFWSNPLRPTYCGRTAETGGAAGPLRWSAHAGGMNGIGWTSDAFSYDNERPAHQMYVEPFELASRLVTNGEFLAFMGEGGYQRPEFWLSDGWDVVQSQGWNSPLYWERAGMQWRESTLAGMQEIPPDVPVCHVSFFEADAFARWAGCRLPTEFEWEAVAHSLPVQGNFYESGRLHPSVAPQGIDSNRPAQMFGDLWEWTASQYRPYPRYVPENGALGEYNGKFMCNQFVLRGGSCVTPGSHVRATYRNFFPPDKRWAFSGIRLARDPA